MAAKIVDMKGRRYGKLLCIGPVGPGKHRSFDWSFQCVCGTSLIASGHEVRRGGITCCSECSAKNKAAVKTTHGETASAEYRTWCAMKSRCENPNFEAYENYGGRGITVCKAWANSFEQFLADMGRRPSKDATIDRQDTNGNYEPSNCRWATRLEQANNKRNNHLVEIGGITRTVAQWARTCDLTEAGIRARIRRGISGQELISPKRTQS